MCSIWSFVKVDVKEQNKTGKEKGEILGFYTEDGPQVVPF